MQARVILADDEQRVTAALRLLLENEAGMDVVGEVANAPGLPGLAATEQPDIVLLDWELPGLHGKDNGARAANLLAALAKVRPGARVVALSARPEAREAALRAGAHAFVTKLDPPRVLLDTIVSLLPWATLEA